MTSNTDYFSRNAIVKYKEIPLANSPLARVLIQVQFSSIGAHRFDEAFIKSMHEVLAPNLPHSKQEKIELRMPNGHIDEKKLVHFHDADYLEQVSLADSFLTYDVGRYTSRSQFVSEFKRLLLSLIHI